MTSFISVDNHSDLLISIELVFSHTNYGKLKMNYFNPSKELIQTDQRTKLLQKSQDFVDKSTPLLETYRILDSILTITFHRKIMI